MTSKQHRGRKNNDDPILSSRLDAKSGASMQSAGGLFSGYFSSHVTALTQSFERIIHSPLSSLMTIAVIGIALALPAGLHVVMKNIQGMSADWESVAQISLFLDRGLQDAEVQRLVDTIEARPEVDFVTHITPQQAMDEFRQFSGFGEALEVFEENPLTTVLVVHPVREQSAPALVEPLLEQLRQLPGVEMAQLDLEWVQRLFALMEIGKRGVLVLAILLSLAVLLIVGNTIRLAIQNRRDEIEVQKLIGATDSFIQRPFLYSGFWHGLFGAVIAWILVTLSLWSLNGPVRRLSVLYDSHFELGSLSWAVSVSLMAVGGGLGFIGAWFAVGRHLKEIEPT